MKFTMPRDRVVVSKFGRSFEFKKNEPLHVAEMCWDEVQAAGAVPEDEIDVSEESTLRAPQGVERKGLLIEAVRKMVLKGERTDFTGTGAPNAQVLSDLVGFAVDAKERDTVWAAAQNDE